MASVVVEVVGVAENGDGTGFSRLGFADGDVSCSGVRVVAVDPVGSDS